MPQKCGACDGELTMGGPIWTPPIHNTNFVQELLATVQQQETRDAFTTHKRLEAFLSSIVSESTLGQIPLNYDLANVCSHIKVETPRKNEMEHAFKSLGFNLTQTYYDPKLYKTDAPPETVYDIFKAFKKAQGDENYMRGAKEGNLAHRFLSKEIVAKPKILQGDALVEENKGKKRDEKQKHKFYVVQEANWGPKPRATGKK